MTDLRSQRLRVLADLLRSGQVASQEQATASLKSAGFTVTQATVSRDLDSLGAVKLKRNGVMSYSLPEQIGHADWSTGRLERLLGEFVLSIEAAGGLVVLKTPPGSAHLVASALDSAHLPEIAGTVSGDDTVFAALRDGSDTATLVRRLEQMAGLEKARFA